MLQILSTSNETSTGPELVQNGDFSELGSDLVQNGDFAEIGSELITNGDFSATGSELVTNGDFSGGSSNWTLGTGWSVGEDKLNAINVDVTYTTQTGFTFVGKSFQVVYTISNYTQGEINLILGGYVATANRSSNGTFTEYITINTANTTLYIQGINSFTGSISNISIKELGEDWTLGNGWSIEEDKASVDASVTTTLSQSPVSITNGKSYKISLEITDYQSGFLKPQFGGQIIGDFNSNGVKTFYATADATSSTTFYLYALGTSDFSVSNVTVKEVGQGWTVSNADATHYVEFPGVGARYVSDTMSPDLFLSQLGIITPGKSYTVTCHVAYAVGSGALKCQVGGTDSASFSEGANTETITAGVGTSFYLIRAAADVDCVITNVTVTQVGGGNLERWWRMNGSQGPTAAPPAPADYITANQAPNGIVNAIIPSSSPLLDQDTP